jgi:hypothetical protein
VEGDNVINVAGTDNVRNTSTSKITIKYQPVAGAQIELVSGHGTGDGEKLGRF